MINLMARDIDAGQVCKYVRTNEDLSGTKIIAMTNKLSETEVTALHKKGFDAVLTDPADNRHIIRTIEEVTAIIY